MTDIFSLVFLPLAWLLRSLYFLFNSYGVAIIVFCLITKIILFPLSLKGKKSMIKMNALSAKQQQLQKQFGKDKNRLNAEIQKLYDQENVNPMGGCLWSLLPLPILIGLYGVIRQPLHYLMQLSSDQINDLSNFLFGSVIPTSANSEIKIAEELFHRYNDVVATLPDLADKLFRLDFSFLGMNLAATPQWNPTQFSSFSWGNIGLFLIPIISAVLAFFSMQISMKTNGGNSNKDNPMANNKTMMFSMPLISLWIGYTLPASLGIYWIANNVFTMLQEMIAGKILAKDYAAAAAEREERERQQKEEEKSKRRQAAEEKAKAAEHKKKQQQAERKVSADVLANSRVGIRAYARGRAYDPDRYGGVTPYRDPVAPAGEAAAEAGQAEETAANDEAARITAAAAVPEQAAQEETVVSAAGAAPAAGEEPSDHADDYEAEAEESAEDEEK